MLQFRLPTLMFLMLLTAVCLCWWQGHSNRQAQIDALEAKLKKLQTPEPVAFDWLW